MTLEAGSRLGPYEIVALIGAGGMGEVYRAHDSRLRREVAIKVLPEAVAANRDRLSRFEREARAAGALNHPNILSVFDVGNQDGAPFVVMELLEGETLRDVVARRSPTPNQVLAWGVAVARGLSAAHQKGIVHRDLKPENLFLTVDGQIKILDFGLAKLLSPTELGRSTTLQEPSEVATGAPTATSPTRPGVALGTVAYMSPEQVRAEALDQRSDIFSLGVVLYESLAGEHPFRRRSLAETMMAIVHESPSELSRAQEGVPRGLERIVLRCLEKEPAKRFQSAHDLGLALEALLERPYDRTELLSIEERSPYPGLSSFTEDRASDFFGREEAVEALWERLRRRRFLALIGPSGAGKTSFIRAGVVASKPEGWAAIVVTPGTSPMRGLGQALGPQLARDPEALRQLAGFEDPGTALDLFIRWRKSHDQALVVIDQFEELFTLNPPEAQAQVAGFLGRLVNEADVRVLLSLRDDFLMRCNDQEALTPVFRELTPLDALTEAGMREAMMRPAESQGYQFEDAQLVEDMLSAVRGARGALPLLAFAVARLWEKRDLRRRLLTRDAYREIGGVEGALAQHAEATLARVGSEREPIVREIFRNLTTAQQTRAVLDREELLSALPERSAAEDVLRQLLDARLLVSFEAPFDGAQPGGHRVEIVHESLLKAWPRLVRWQTQDADGAQLRDQLRQAAHVWAERERAEELVWTGVSYLDYRAWKERYRSGLSSVEEDFAKAMANLANRRRRRRRLLVVGTVGTLAIGLGVVVALWRQSQAEAQRAEASKLLTLAQLHLDVDPSAALAFATKSIELSDNPIAREFALRLLQEFPTAIGDFSLEDPALSLAFSRNGDWLAIGGYLRVVLRSRNGRETRVLHRDYSTEVQPIGVKFARDKDILVTNKQGDIRLWSCPDGRELRGMRQAGGTSWLAISDAGFFSSTRTPDRETIFFSPFEKGETRSIGELKVLATGDLDGSATRYAYADGRKIFVRSLDDWTRKPQLIAENPTEVGILKVHPDGGSVAVLDSAGDVRIWSTREKSGRPSRVLANSGGDDLLFSPSGRWLAVSCTMEGHPRVRLWDLTSPPGAEPLLLRGQGQSFTDWSFDPSEQWLATSHGGFVNVWPLGVTFPRRLSEHVSVVAMRFAPDGKRLIVSTPQGVSSLAISPEGPNDPVTLFPGEGTAMALDPVGNRVAVASTEGRVSVIPLGGGPARSLEGFSKRCSMGAVSFSSGGRRVAAATIDGPAQEKVVRIWDLDSGAVQVLGPVPGAGDAIVGGIFSLSFLEPDRILAAFTRGGGLGGSGLMVFDLPSGRVSVLAWKPNTSVVVSRTSQFGLGTQWTRGGFDLLRFTFDGKPPAVVASHPGAIAVAMNASETLVATGGFDGTVRIGPLSGAEPHLFLGHQGVVRSLAFSPDGRWLASAGDDRTIRLWPVPDVTKTAPHKRTHEEFLATLRSWTNLRAVPDAALDSGWKALPDPFPGWQTPPKW